MIAHADLLALIDAEITTCEAEHAVGNVYLSRGAYGRLLRAVREVFQKHEPYGPKCAGAGLCRHIHCAGEEWPCPDVKPFADWAESLKGGKP